MKDLPHGRESVRRHSKRQQRICYSVKERDSNGKNRDWVSLLVYKEVAGEAGRRILAWGSDAKGWNGCVYLFIRRQVNHF